MEKMIDILPFLEEVVEKNTQLYQSDLAYDEKRLQEAKRETQQENRTFLWMSRPCGTYCVLEREAFMRGTGAHTIWTGYEHEAEKIKAYRIIVAPGYAGAYALGKIQPLNYGEQLQRVKKNAVPVHTVEMTFEDGEHLILPYEDYRRQIRGLYDIHGRVETIWYAPENKLELSCILQAERAISTAKKRPPRKKKPATR